MRPALIAAALLTFLACTAGGGEPWEPPGQTDLPQSMTDCSGGEGCVVVQLGCCDHCNGGMAVAVVDGMGQQALDDYAETCNPPVACTEIGCAPVTAQCDEGTCVLIEGTL